MRYTLLILVIAILASCSKDEKTNYKEENENEIIQYIATNHLNAQKSSSGLHYVIEEPGTGKEANPNSYVNVSYKGYLTNGNRFDESDSNGIYAPLQQVILGWIEGISYFKEGGSGKLLIPAHLGFGNSSKSKIPAGSVLIYDIKLIKVYDDYNDMETNIKTKNEKEISDYLEINNLTAQKTVSGLHYIIEKEGTGAQPTASSNVTVAYKGYFINKSVFDQSNLSGVPFNLQGVIKGWTEGIPLFKVGGKGKLFVPSHLGYGPYGRGNIPGGAVLIFDIDLINSN